jgi:hypothetical protein
MTEERVHWILEGNCALCGANADFKPYKKGKAVDGVFHRFTDWQPEQVNCPYCLGNIQALRGKVEKSKAELKLAINAHGLLVHALELFESVLREV